MGNIIIKLIFLGCIVSILSGCASSGMVDESLNTLEINSQITSLAQADQDNKERKHALAEPAKLTLTDMSSPLTSKQRFVLNTFLIQQNKQHSFATINFSIATHDYSAISTFLANAREIKALLTKEGIDSEIMFKPDGVAGQMIIIMEVGAEHAK